MAEYLKVVYVTYRNMLMNFCCVLLIICVNVATAQYELYKPVKEQAERIKKQEAK